MLHWQCLRIIQYLIGNIGQTGKPLPGYFQHLIRYIHQQIFRCRKMLIPKVSKQASTRPQIQNPPRRRQITGKQLRCALVKIIKARNEFPPVSIIFSGNEIKLLFHIHFKHPYPKIMFLIIQ